MKRKGRRQKQRTGLRLTAIMVLIICGIVTLKTQELKAESQKSDARIAELKKEIAKEEEKAKDIEKQKAYMQTLDFVEDMAREKFGLVYKDEIIFQANDK